MGHISTWLWQSFSRRRRLILLNLFVWCVSVCLCVLCLCSGLNGDTFPLHALPGLWDYVSCVHHAALHSQQHTTGKINLCIFKQKWRDFLFLFCVTGAFVSSTRFISWSCHTVTIFSNVSAVVLKKLHQSQKSMITHVCSNVHALVNALEIASVLCNKHDIKILPPSVHSHHEGIHCRLAGDTEYSWLSALYVQSVV